MGAPALMSTLHERAVRKIPSTEQIPVFSGKLSILMANSSDPVRTEPPAPPEGQQPAGAAPQPAEPAREIGGREGPEPTRFGDWELRGRCIDF
jgi:hypothetical protein